MKTTMRCIVFLLVTIAASKGSAAIIPPARAIDWSQSGVPGGIPYRTTISATINASAYGNGSTDATSGIQTALNNCSANQTVFLSVGSFLINTALRVPSNVTLRGAGPRETILDAHGSGGAVISFGQDATPYSSNSRAITGGTNAGSTSLTLASASGISVGSYLLITELNDTGFVTIKGGEGSCTWCDGGIGWNGTRALGQIVEVASVSGASVGMSPALYLTYAPALVPLATPFSAGARYGGVEDLQVYVNNTGYITNFLMNGSAFCWIRNIESNYTDGDHLRAFWAYRCEIRDSYFHDAYHHTPGQTDADVFIADKSSGLLIENNILRRMHASIMLNWGAAGNVIGYNYSANDFDENAYNVVMGDFSMHGSHPMFNLYEGNIATSFHPDGIWGSNSHNTAFRNWFKGTTKISKPLAGRGLERTDSTWWACQANRAINIDFAGRYYNIIGNVAGSPELLKITSYNNGTHVIPAVRMVVAPEYRSYDGPTYCYSFGYSEANDDGSSGTYPEDNRLPYTTALLHGNYDYASDSIFWDAAVSDHNLPASLYLPAKPAWWCGALPWPAVGPDIAGYVNDNPAKARFEGSGGCGTAAKAGQPVYRRLPNLNCDASGRIAYQTVRVGRVRLEIFNAQGRRIRTLVDAYEGAGGHCVSWKEKERHAGVYRIRFTSGGDVMTKKLTIVR